MVAPTIVSLCSGIAGLDLGVRRALGAARTVLYVERELTAARVLEAQIAAGRLDDAPIWSDVTTLVGTAWRGLVDGVVAGIPCQPHSVAGKGLGADDPRDLWPVTARLLRDIEPGWFFLENVPGILRYYHGRIRPELHAMGYRTAEALVTAAEVGAPHKRERLFVLAHRTGGGWGVGGQSPRSDGLAASCGEHVEHATSIGHERSGGTRRGRRGPADAGGVVGDTEREGCRQVAPASAGPRSPGEPQWASFPPFPPRPADRDAWAAVLDRWSDGAPATTVAYGVTARGREALRRAGTPEPGFRHVADGVPAGLAGLSRADKLRMLGNAVVPAQAEHAMRLMMAEHAP